MESNLLYKQQLIVRYFTSVCDKAHLFMTPNFHRRLNADKFSEP